jgi:hypothetical protein
VGDIDTAVVDSLKVLDLKWPIREADMQQIGSMSAFGGEADITAIYMLLGLGR